MPITGVPAIDGPEVWGGLKDAWDAVKTMWDYTFDPSTGSAKDKAVGAITGHMTQEQYAQTRENAIKLVDPSKVDADALREQLKNVEKSIQKLHDNENPVSSESVFKFGAQISGLVVIVLVLAGLFLLVKTMGAKI